jgi:hypothetical protein
LSIEQKIERTLAPLFAALDAAQTNIDQVLSELKSVGFTDGAGAYVATVYRAFVQTSHILSASEHADTPIRLVRSFALDLNNEHDDPAAAAALLSGLARARPPEDRQLATQLDADIRIVENNRDDRLLTQAIARENYGEAIRLVDLMVARTPSGDDSVQLRTLQENLKQQRNRRYLKWGGWAVAAGFVIYIISQDGGGTLSPPSTYAPERAQVASSDSPSTPTAAVTSDPALSASIEAPPANPDVDLTTDVTTPPVGTSLELDASQVRYCTFEEARLTALKELVVDTNAAAIDDFNARVDDYNSRCGSFRYHATDLDAARAAAERDADRLASEARAIAEGWTQ